MAKLRFIGDLHGHTDAYKQIIADADYSIQVGDLAFQYSFLKDVDFSKHHFFCGNHDNHDDCQNWPHWLGRYGELNGDMFFVGGGFSIDWKQRTPKLDYWPDEELTLAECGAAFSSYKINKPRIMLSHEAPRSIIHNFTNGDILTRFGHDPVTFTTQTSELLDEMFAYHQPELWIFGHYHIKWFGEINGTKFMCLPPGGYLDVEIKL